MGGLQQVEEACWAVIKRWQFSVPTVGEYVVQLYSVGRKQRVTIRDWKNP